MAWPFSLFRRGPPALARRALEAGSQLRPWGAPIGDGISNASTLAGLDLVRRKSRHAAVNNAWLGNGINAWVTALIGTGITAVSAVADPAAIHARQTRWCDQADADQRTDFFGLQSQVARQVAVDGEAFVVLLNDPAGLRLRILPAEAIDLSDTRELGDGRRVVAGIEFNAAGQRVAYHIRPDVGTSPFTTVLPPIRVDAADICHVFKPIFPGQVRGIPWAASVLMSISEMDQLCDALLVAAKISAMHAGFIIDLNSTAGIPYDGTQTGSILQGGLEPGTLKILPSGFDVKFSSPQQANSAMDLGKMTLRSIAAGLGLPDYLVSGDLSQANYSSLRAGLVEFRARVSQIQYHVLIPQFLGPVWRRWLTLEILAGRIDAPGFETDPESWLAVEMYPPAQQWIDPAKDAQAEAEMIASGLKSRRQAVAERGFSIESLDAEIAADRERERRLGLSFAAPSPASGNTP